MSVDQLSDSELEQLAALRDRMKDMPEEEKQALLRQLTPKNSTGTVGRTMVEKEQGERAALSQGIKAPKNDDELWQLIKDLTGYEIPRVAVCPDHQAPFDWMAAAYFNRHRAILVLGSREMGKSIGASILQYISAETKPGYEGLIFAAIQPQAKQVYRYIRSFVFNKDSEGNRKPKPQILGDPTRERTEWRSGSVISCIVGSMSGVNSPHPNTVHADEIDLMDVEIFDESRAMSSSSVVDGVKIPALDLATSTRKSMRGPMQKLIDEIEKAKKEGFTPSWSLYASCVREVAQEVPSCRRADPVQRVHRLVELGRDPRELCRCDLITKGSWSTQFDENGDEKSVPRTLESCCRGDFFKSRGWYPYEDLVGKFQQLSKAKWEAQMECRRPLADGLYLPGFSREQHVIRGWVPRPEYGTLWIGCDWGGTAPSVVIWIQGPTLAPIQVRGYEGTEFTVPQNSYVAFDMFEQSAIGASKLADLVVLREATWRQRFPGWRVRGRFTDMAGKQQRDDWHQHSPPLRTHWYVDRAFDASIDAIVDVVNDSRLFVDANTCLPLIEDFESWRQKNGREVQDLSTHAPAACLIGGTLVATDHGPRAIEEIEVGDLVWTREGLQPVEMSCRSGDVEQQVVEVTFSDGNSIIATRDHPIWVVGQGWIDAGAVRYGDSALKREGSVSVVSVKDAGVAWVYDLTVANAHEFFANGVLTHNTRYCLVNCLALERRDGRRLAQNKILPVVRERESLSLPATSNGGMVDGPTTSPGTGVETEQWRRSFQPASSDGGFNNHGQNGWRIG